MSEKKSIYILESLSENSVNVVIETYVNFEGEEYKLGRYRKCYANSPYGRILVEEELPESYRNAIFEIWGDTPTLEDPENPNQ